MSGNKTHKHKKKTPSNWFKAIGLCLFAFAVGYLTATTPGFWGWIDDGISNIFTKDAPRKIHEVAEKKQNIPKPKFEFYTMLTKEQEDEHKLAQTSEVEVSLPIKPKVIDHSKNALEPTKSMHKARKSYKLQVASFKVQTDAEKMKASLILKGYDVFIVEATINGGNWYRVMVGEAENFNEAKKLQATFARNEHVVGVIHRMES